MGSLELFKPVLNVATIDNDVGYKSFLSQNSRGICFVAEGLGLDAEPNVLKADFGDFAKWVREENPEIPISVPPNTPKILLRSADVWLPLIYLAGDTSVQIFLNMAASYFYDRAKGSLKSDRPRIHMSIIYQDKSAGITKKFEFSGDADTLGKAIKRFDPNNFFNDAP